MWLQCHLFHTIPETLDKCRKRTYCDNWNKEFFLVNLILNKIFGYSFCVSLWMLSLCWCVAKRLYNFVYIFFSSDVIWIVVYSYYCFLKSCVFHTQKCWLMNEKYKNVKKCCFSNCEYFQLNSWFETKQKTKKKTIERFVCEKKI